MTDYVKAPFGVFELRKGRPPILHEGGNRLTYTKFKIEWLGRIMSAPLGHDFTTAEVRQWTEASSKWQYISEQEAKDLISPHEGGE